MPELPEVETVVRGLQAALPGRRILDLHFGKTDFVDDPAAISEKVPGSTIERIRRHGKFIVMELARCGGSARDSGSPQSSLRLIVHLGMTGQLLVATSGAPVGTHTHVFFALDNGRELRYRDIRRFGRMRLEDSGGSDGILSLLGLDPLEATAREFSNAVKMRRARIKALLLDQHVFRGIGNIYTDESLFRAKIHPARLGSSLTAPELTRLRAAVRGILLSAIRLGGSTISDYVDAAGEPGEFQIRHRVYQRMGKKCYRCGAIIQRIIVAGRSSYFCPQCQRAPRSSRAKNQARANHRQRSRVSKSRRRR